MLFKYACVEACIDIFIDFLSHFLCNLIFSYSADLQKYDRVLWFFFAFVWSTKIAYSVMMLHNFSSKCNTNIAKKEKRARAISRV